MPLKSAHPYYTEMSEKWELAKDSYDGEDAIKDKGTQYLPATSGQKLDGQGQSGRPGNDDYEAYKIRAVYPDIYKDAVEATIGIMHREPPNIELPEQLEIMRENSTLLGESLEMLLWKINAHQLTTGRLGLLADLKEDDEEEVRPVILTYEELSIRNWDDTNVAGDDVDVRLVVLDESAYELGTGFTWEMKEKYRVLSLTGSEGSKGVYASGVGEGGDEVDSVEMLTPSLRGATLEKIPFVFVNSKDLSPVPDNPPLHGLARFCLTIYRAEADYRQHLYMQSQDTLVRIGVHDPDDDEAVRTGAGARIDVPINGDAKYIGVSSRGLPEQRTSLENDYRRAIQKSGQLLDATSRAKESGDALRIRVAAQTATLPLIAKTGAAGLERVLRAIARWYGADETKVKVTPNLNFTEADLRGDTLVQIIQAKTLGAPISERSIHEWMREQGFTKMNYEEELGHISSQAPAPGQGVPSPADTDPEVDNNTDNEDDVTEE